MNKKKKDLSKLSLKSKPSTGANNDISQFFAPNEPSTSTSIEISRPLTESVNANILQPAVPSIVNTLISYEYTKDKMNRLLKRKSDLNTSPIDNFFETTNNVSIADFETPKRVKTAVKKPTVQPKTKRPINGTRLKQNNIKKLLQANKTEEGLFSDLLAQQCASENLHPDELQMALALSRSLVETFSQESTTSNDPAIEKSSEARFSDIQKTLENFGFKSAGQYAICDPKPIARSNKNHKWRRKFSNQNLDYIRKSFDEKLSMIFKENREQNVSNEQNEYAVSSRLLRDMKIRSEDTLFRLQSSDMHSSKLTDRYYSGNIFEISTVRSDFLLKNWDEIPGRTPSPTRHQSFDLSKITELSEELSKNVLEFPKFDSDTEIVELNNDKPSDTSILTRNWSRDVESPDLFSDSDLEPDEANKSPPKPNEHLMHETDNSAKKKNVSVSKLCETNDDIFADFSVDMIDLTSDCGSAGEENTRAPSLSEKNLDIFAQRETTFTLSSETTISESVRSEIVNSMDLVENPTLFEPDSFLTSNMVALDMDALNNIEDRDINHNLSVSDQFNTEDITLVYSDDENRSKESETQDNNKNGWPYIVILSDDSDDDKNSIRISQIPSQNKATHHDSIANFIELPHFSENSVIDNAVYTDDTPPLSLAPNFQFAHDQDTVITELTDEDASFEMGKSSGILNHVEDENINLLPTSNNDTQNITLVFSEDDDEYHENLKPNKEKSPLPDSNSSKNLSNKTPPRQHSILDFSDIPNLNNHNEFIQNLTQNISDSIEISDDEINYSTAQLNQITPTKTPPKSVEISSDDENDLLEEKSNLLEKSMHSFMRRYEKNMSEESSTVEDGNDENNEVNKSVNEFLFKSRFESMEKRPSISSTKALFKRYPSEPSFSRAVSKTPKRLCFEKLKNDVDEFDQLVFGEKLNHDVVVLAESPLREIPKSPEPPAEHNFTEPNCPYNYFQPDEEYDIVMNQNTPKVNLNGTIDLNETVYDGEKYIYKTRNVTPEPDYNSMDICKLHVELKKFGLKKISRAKAIKLLEYIYNETHPIIQDTDKESIIDSDHHQISSSQPVKPTAQSPMKLVELSTTTTQLIGTWTGIDFSACDNDIDYLRNDNFTLNLLNSNEMVYLPSKPRSGKIQYCNLPLHIAFYNLFRSNSMLRNAIFLYQPIEVEKIYFHFKSIGAKYEMNDLISFLDRHCITFRTDPKNKSNGARTKK